MQAWHPQYITRGSYLQVYLRIKKNWDQVKININLKRSAKPEIPNN